MEMTIEQVTQHVVSELNKNYFMIPRVNKGGTFNRVEYIEKIINVACAYRCITIEAFSSRIKTTPLVHCRYMIYLFIKKYAPEKIDLQLIAGFVKKDRTTIVTATKTANALLRFNREFKHENELFEKHLCELLNINQQK